MNDIIKWTVAQILGDARVPDIKGLPTKIVKS